MPTQKFSAQLLIYANLYQHAKNQAISLIRSGDTVYHVMSQEQKFSQIWDLCRNIANNITFHNRTNSAKANDQIFQ